MKITLDDIRSLFSPTTRIRLSCLWYDEAGLKHRDRIYLDNLFFGISAFASMEVLHQSIHVIGENCIEIETDMPIKVFKAMKEYIENYQ